MKPRDKLGREYADADYLHRLNPAQRAWYSAFEELYYGSSKREGWTRANARRRDALSQPRSEFVNASGEELHSASMSEDDLVAIIDFRASQQVIQLPVRGQKREVA